MHDNIALLDFTTSSAGKAKRTMVWGVSQGGSIVAQLIQRFPDRFDGAIPLSGQVAGAVGAQNLRLDSAFVLQTLLPGGMNLSIVNISDPMAALDQVQQVVLRVSKISTGCVPRHST